MRRPPTATAPAGEIVMMRDPIYLDGHATTPLAPEARDAMLEAWTRPGNPTSPHRDGERAARLIDAARADVARLIGASPGEIVFTSGATEANNLAILGVARRARRLGDPRRRIVVSAIEHKAVLEPAKRLRDEGFEIDIVPVDPSGVVDLSALQAAVGDDTLLVSIMAANNETGAIQPLGDVARIARTVGALVHADAAQAAGKMPIDVLDLDIDYMSLSAHKLYGPMGVGALFIAAGSPSPDALQVGGGQQQGLRSGTEPTPLLVGFGAAARLATQRMEVDDAHRRDLARRLLDGLSTRQIRHRLTTGGAPTVSGSLSLLIDGVDAEAIVQLIAANVSLSTGSACNAGQVEPSHVLTAMGIDQHELRSVLRLFCNRYNTIREIDAAAGFIAEAIGRSRVAPGEVRQ
jgi:cysteine desulfurase